MKTELFLHRCACGRYTSAEEGWNYIHADDPYHLLSGPYCNEACAEKAVRENIVVDRGSPSASPPDACERRGCDKFIVDGLRVYLIRTGRPTWCCSGCAKFAISTGLFETLIDRHMRLDREAKEKT